MRPKDQRIDILEGPLHHNLMLQARSPPGWQYTWASYIPLVGQYLNVFVNIALYTTKLEDVADVLAEDLVMGHESQFVGEFVGMKQQSMHVAKTE